MRTGAKQRTISLPGRYTEIEEAILNYLYENPSTPTGTAHLLIALRPQQTPASFEPVVGEARNKEFDEIQYAIETLIADGLAAGQRIVQSQRLQYVQLKLTRKGEAQAIVEKRRPKEVTSTIPRPGDDGKG